MKIKAYTVTKLILTAAGSSDPDAQKELDYEWIVYPEPENFDGTFRIEGAHSQMATLEVSAGSGHRCLHVILSATDRGEPRLTRYRRALVHVEAF